MTRSIKITLAILALLVLAAILLSIGIRQTRSADGDKATVPVNASKGDLSIKLTTAAGTFRYGQALAFDATIRNTGSAPRTYTFNSTCTQGELSVDGQPTQRDLLCGQAITEVSLRPGETKDYQYNFKLVKTFSSPVEGSPIDHNGEIALRPGKHTAVLKWQSIQSNPVDFTVAE